jgi:hypothetical protein
MRPISRIIDPAYHRLAISVADPFEGGRHLVQPDTGVRGELGREGPDAAGGADNQDVERGRPGRRRTPRGP